MPGLTYKQKKFALEYRVDNNGTQAVIRAGYSHRGADVTACRLLADPKIRALIDARQEKALEKIGTRGDLILEETAHFAHSDILEAFNEDGTLKHPKDMSPKLRRAIRSIEFTELFEGASGEKFVTGRIVKISLWDKPAGLKMLGDNVGLFKSAAEKKIDESLADLLAQAMKPEVAGE